MKLRLRHNSVRLRLTQGEVAQLRDSGSVEERIEFSPDQTLAYRVVSDPDQASIAASFVGGNILLTVPTATVRQWADSEQVEMQAGGALRISIEKDFKCLDAAHPEDDVDTFPNPLAGKVC